MRALEPEIGTTCELCQSARRMDGGEDQFAIARLSTGYVSLCATQHFVGYTFFFTKLCVPEIHDLAKPTRTTHLHEMAEVAHALARAFNPRKLNYEALGNGTPHLVVTGAQTDACVRATLHGAFTRGYDTLLVADTHTTEDFSDYGLPPADKVIADTNMYWTWQSAPGRTATVVETADVDFHTMEQAGVTSSG